MRVKKGMFKLVLTWVFTIESGCFAESILLNELKRRWTSTRKESSFCPPVALEKRILDWMTNLEMNSRDRKHFWIGSWLSVDVDRSAQCRTQLRRPLKKILEAVKERNLNHVQIKVLIKVLLCEQLIQYSKWLLPPASTQNLMKTSWIFNSTVHIWVQTLPYLT